MISFVVLLACLLPVSCQHRIQKIMESVWSLRVPQFETLPAFQPLNGALLSTILLASLSRANTERNVRTPFLAFLGGLSGRQLQGLSGRQNVEKGKDALVRKALLDTTNRFHAGNGKAGARLDFPPNLCVGKSAKGPFVFSEYAKDGELKKELRRFLQEPGATNDHKPIFPKNEYVLLLTAPRPREATDNVPRPHVDAEGGPRFVLLGILGGMSVALSSHIGIIEKAVEHILTHPDPKARFDEVGVITCNAWWVCTGRRKLSIMGQHAFAQVSHGKSLWDFFEHRRNQGFCEGSGSFVTDADDASNWELVGGAPGQGVIWNSALNLHYGFNESSAPGLSRESRIVALPVKFLNEIARENVDWAGLAGPEVSPLRPPGVSPAKWDIGSDNTGNWDNLLSGQDRVLRRTENKLHKTPNLGPCDRPVWDSNPLSSWSNEWVNIAGSYNR